MEICLFAFSFRWEPTCRRMRRVLHSRRLRTSYILAWYMSPAFARRSRANAQLHAYRIAAKCEEQHVYLGLPSFIEICLNSVRFLLSLRGHLSKDASFLSNYSQLVWHKSTAFLGDLRHPHSPGGHLDPRQTF